MKPQELMDHLEGDDLFRQWHTQHPEGYLTHFFCQIDPEFQVKTNWEIGFYETETGKITVFSLLPKQTWEIKPADEVFQKEQAAIDRLDLKKVQVSMQNAEQACLTQMQATYPKEK